MQARDPVVLAPMGDATGSPASLPPVLQEAIGKFSAWAEQHLQAEQTASTITAPLYHYTNGPGLKGILESGRVWFTDYRHLNDPSELTHGIDMAHVRAAFALTMGARSGLLSMRATANSRRSGFRFIWNNAPQPFALRVIAGSY